MTTERTIELPKPGYPMLTRLLSDPLFLEKAEPVAWVVSGPHPLVGNMRIVRMFVGDSGAIEIYSVSSDGKTGMRNLVPVNRVRLVEEGMPIEVFVDELVAAESPDEEDEPDDEPEESQLNGMPPVEIPSNGQVVSSS